MQIDCFFLTFASSYYGLVDWFILTKSFDLLVSLSYDSCALCTVVLTLKFKYLVAKCLQRPMLLQTSLATILVALIHRSFVLLICKIYLVQVYFWLPRWVSRLENVILMWLMSMSCVFVLFSRHFNLEWNFLMWCVFFFVCFCFNSVIGVFQCCCLDLDFEIVRRESVNKTLRTHFRMTFSKMWKKIRNTFNFSQPEKRKELYKQTSAGWKYVLKEKSIKTVCVFFC